MNFEQIFEREGLYKAEGFAKGVCLKVDEHGFLRLVTYTNEDDLLPTEENALMYKGLLSKQYEKVFTRQSLFK